MAIFTENENQSLQGKLETARIITYDTKRGYGFARTPDGKEVFVSSYQVINRKEERNIMFGSRISFKYGFYNGKLCATEVTVLDMFPAGELIEIHGKNKDWTFHVSEIAKLGTSQLLHNKKFLEEALTEEAIPSDYLERDYGEKDFKCMFVEMKDGTIHRFFNKGSKMNGCDHIDVTTTYTGIYNDFFIETN